MAPKIESDDVYQVQAPKLEEEPKRLKRDIVWRNVIYMTLLHLGALYGITLLPSCSRYTWLFTVLLYQLASMGITAGNASNRASSIPNHGKGGNTRAVAERLLAEVYV